jgi:predicted MFS family arabinose efflux permease
MESMIETELGRPLPALTRSQWMFLLLLAAVQFTHIVDFIIIMPLATDLERTLDINTRQFGLIVSVYGFAASAAGLLLAPLLDRFDRKFTLLTLYAGFTLGTLFCAFAPSYPLLLVARVMTGAFGGVAAATVLAIVGDAFPPERRGTAMGAIMSAFSMASIAGVPAGLLLAEQMDTWRAPFWVLGAGSALLLALAWQIMPSVRGHLGARHEAGRFWQVLSRPAHLNAYALMLALVMSTFTIVPFIAAFLEKNVGRTKGDIRLVYLYGGAATLLSMNLIGRLSDRFSRLTVFRLFAGLALIPIVGLTHLHAGASLGLTLLATTALMVLTSGRMVPAMAMITSAAEPRYRGSFLSINSSVQQLAAGLAPLIAGFLMGEGAKGDPLMGYDVVGFVGVAAGATSIVLAGRLRPAPVERNAPPLAAEAA